MEIFLQIFTICFLFLIGAGLFSLLLSLSDRISVLLLEDDAEDEARYAAYLKSRGQQPEAQKAETESQKEALQSEAPPLTKEERAARWARYSPGKLLKRDYVCDSCGQVLKAYELIPVFSFLFLKGRCRYCKDRIRLRELLAELLGGVLFILIFFRFGKNVMLTEPFSLYGILDITANLTLPKVLGLILLYLTAALLFLVSVIDIKTMIIPNGLSLAMLLLGIFGLLLFSDVPWYEHLVGLLCVSLPMLLLTLLIPGAFGGGDIKLMAGAGLLLGWKLTVLAAFLGIIGGGLFGSILLATKKAGRKAHFAFGPFLCIGIMISAFCGFSMLNGYLAYVRGAFF